MVDQNEAVKQCQIGAAKEESQQTNDDNDRAERAEAFVKLLQTKCQQELLFGAKIPHKTDKQQQRLNKIFEFVKSFNFDFILFKIKLFFIFFFFFLSSLSLSLFFFSD